MADASFWTVATVTASVAAGTGVIAGPVLAPFGIDGYSVGAGLLGCVVAQVFAPPERVTIRRVAATAVGSVLVASFGAPYVSPAFSIGGMVTREHASAVASALLGASAKPIYLLAKAWFEKIFEKMLPAVNQKGPEDA